MNYLKEIKNYKKEFLLAQFFAILATLIAIPIPLLIPLLIDEVVLGKKGFLTNTIDFFINNCNGVCYILITLLIVILGRILFVFFNVLQTYFFEKITKDIAFKLRKKILNHLKKLSINEYENLKNGDIASKVINDVNTIEDFLIKSVSKLFISTLMIIGISIVLLYINWKLGLFILILNPFVIILSSKIAKKVKFLKKEENQAISVFQEAFIETLELFEQIKAYNKEDFFFKKLKTLLENLKNKSFNFSYKSEAMSKISFVIFLIGFETFRTAGILAVMYDNLSIGLMLAVFGYLWYMMGPIQDILSIQYSFFAAKAANERINHILNLKTENITFIKKLSSPVSIEIKNLYFKYDNEWILEDVNAKFNPNEITALTGPSGGGKTTLAKIIAGLLIPNKGKILYNNIDFNNLGIATIRKEVKLILQDTKLFNESIYFNLTLNENFSEEEIYKALKKVKLYEKITSLKDGIYTKIGKNGIKLSGGERQRIAIARALLFKPKVVILDESTSALDIQTEKEVFNNIKDFLLSRTTIIIAHRKETINQANKIYEIKNKKLYKIKNNNSKF